MNVDEENGSGSPYPGRRETLPHIKRVSRVKHAILHKYLPPWARILGSTNRRLCYFDCYAGPGRYELGGKPVDGSPIIAVRAAQRFLSIKPDHFMTLVLIEKDADNVNALEKCLKELEPHPSRLSLHVFSAASQTLVPDILSQTQQLAPSFFMVDPYGHPMSIPIINQILSRRHTEALINLMWYQINRDLGNPAMHPFLDKLFGDQLWRGQQFMHQTGIHREDSFLSYFCSRLNAQFRLPFRIGFDEEDRVYGERTKYYLLHVSNHLRAALLMKEVMWPLGDEDGTFDFSGRSQGILISRAPRLEELREILVREFKGQRVEFDQIREQTWGLPFVEKHYRAVTKQLRSEGLTNVTPVTSKKTGVKGKDLVEFVTRM